VDKVLLSLLVGVVGGAGGALAVDALSPDPASADAAAADPAGLREVRDRLAAIEARLDRPAPVLASAAAAPAPAGDGVADAAASAEAIEAIAVRAAEKALAAQAERSPDAAPARRREEKKRAALADVSREMGLTSGQEDELRRIYAERVDRYLKMLTEPDGDAEALRRELEDAKQDPGKKMAIGMRLLPKYFAKVNDAMALEADTASRVSKVLGPDGYRRYRRSYDVEEADPFGIGGSFQVDAGN
jgi:hypothetical protein